MLGKNIFYFKHALRLTVKGFADMKMENGKKEKNIKAHCIQ